MSSAGDLLESVLCVCVVCVLNACLQWHFYCWGVWAQKGLQLHACCCVRCRLVLGALTNLEELDLADCNLPGSCTYLAEELSNQGMGWLQLEQLDLADCNLPDQ